MDRRHEEHLHTINIKYGYILIAISFTYLLFLVILKRFRDRQILSSGLKTSTLLKAKIPLWIHVTFWLVALISLALFHMMPYVTVIKRFGRLSYSLVPFSLILILRPNVVNYLGFIGLHKWISRLIIASAYIHGFGFYYKWIFEGKLIEQLFRLWNALGILAFLMSGVLVLLSVRMFRRYSYRTFYVYHNITVLCFIILITLHSRPSVSIITALNCVLIALQIYFRFGKNFVIENLQVTDIKLSDLQLVLFSIPPKYPSWSPGSHIRIDYRGNFIFPTHPFTIASNFESGVIELIVKKTSKFKFDEKSSYCISFPFPSTPNGFEAVRGNVLIICGGSGLSFGLPIFNHLNNAGANERASPILVWCTRSKNDFSALKGIRFFDNLKLFVTGQNINSHTNGQTDEFTNDSIELDTFSPTETLLDHGDNSKSDLNYEIGRPDINTLLLELVMSEEGSLLVACGSESLVKDCEVWAANRSMEFIAEIYEM